MAGRANVQVPVTVAVHRVYQPAAGREAEQDSNAVFHNPNAWAEGVSDFY